jgi:hypothetical protein
LVEAEATFAKQAKQRVKTGGESKAVAILPPPSEKVRARDQGGKSGHGPA